MARMTADDRMFELVVNVTRERRRRRDLGYDETPPTPASRDGDEGRSETEPDSR
ncbi:hypothetical protein JOL79_11200 [Microbispora sp. RL4-1S]|uniref:Uncharacterized protein n=1 Tax=Microbispora oryzae TaxID=2806554 RepID=A0A940WP93_9ACTN|nr:hypothetical protein [Microbispora oryzae]MBP2704379.1 hypothetical protein [Microbispora oryzae]